MNKVHYNCKAIRFHLNDKIIDFESREKLLDYMLEEHGLGRTTIVKIIRSKAPYNPRTNCLKYLKGLKIYYI